MAVDPSLLTEAQRIELLDQRYQELAAGFPEGLALIGGEEALLLWHATVDTFAQGIWVATMLCAQATCERTLVGLISLSELPGAGLVGPKGWKSWGLGTIIKHVRKEGLVPDDLLDDVQTLCDARKPYGHWRRPFDPGTLGRSVSEALRHDGDGDPLVIRERLLSQAALQAVTTALLLYFGGHGRGSWE